MAAVIFTGITGNVEMVPQSTGGGPKRHRFPIICSKITANSYNNYNQILELMRIILSK